MISIIRDHFLFYAVLVIVGIAGGVGDVCLYRGAKGSQLFWLVMGLASWLVCLLLFAAVLRWGGRSFSVTFVLSAIIHILIVIAWDLFTQKTKLSSLEYVGVVLAVSGILCIELGQYYRPAEE